MNKFKVGDVVWWLGQKFEIEHVFKSGLLLLRHYGYGVKSNEVKPIIRSYATLGES